MAEVMQHVSAAAGRLSAGSASPTTTGSLSDACVSFAAVTQLSERKVVIKT